MIQICFSSDQRSHRKNIPRSGNGDISRPNAFRGWPVIAPTQREGEAVMELGIPEHAGSGAASVGAGLEIN
jgi:hypothetical protein